MTHRIPTEPRDPDATDQIFELSDDYFRPQHPVPRWAELLGYIVIGAVVLLALAALGGVGIVIWRVWS